MILLDGANRPVWPMHPRLLPDELLSCWMIRLAHANFMKVHSFYALYFGRERQIWNRDIDKLAPDWLIGALAEWTGFEISEVEKATLRAYQGFVFEKINPYGNTAWVLPLGVYHRARKGFGLQFCPHCLESDPLPYFRRSWRLAFITTCVKHRVVLCDRCGSCGAPVVPHRCDIGTKNSYKELGRSIKCHQCFEPLTNSLCEPASGSVMRLQKKFEKALSKGWINWAGNDSMYSLVFFHGLQALCTGLLKKQNLIRLEKHSKLVRNLPKWQSARLDLLSAEDRYLVFSLVAKFMKDWPESMIRYSKKYGLLYSFFRGDYEDLPYWYERVIRGNLSQITAKLNTKEVQSIVDSLMVKHGRFSNTLAIKEVGRDLSSFYEKYRKPKVDQEVAEMFLVSLDHEIAGTRNKKEKQELLRDKIMFGVGRALNLSQYELSTVTIEDIRSRVPVLEEVAFYRSPRSDRQGRAWAEWYYLSIKRKKTKECKTLFFNLRTNRPFSTSSISQRFVRALQVSGLSEAIRTYKNYHCPPV